MNNNSFDQGAIRRPSPNGYYQLPNLTLRVPEDILRLTLQVFSEYAARTVESCCFWYGERDDGGGQVKAVVLPKQRNHWGDFTVPASAMEEVSLVTRSHGWRNLAQLHTHPGRLVEHSAYDDFHVNSRNALSLVFPYYGRWSGTWPNGIGVHEYQGYWYLLPAEHAARRVHVTRPSEKGTLIDVRSRL